MSATASVSPSSTLTSSPTPTFTPSPTASPTRTETPYLSPTPSSTATLSLTPVPPTFTPLPTPITFKIVTVYPNPVGEAGGRIVLALPYACDAVFKIFDLRGELVWSETRAFPAAGTVEQYWGAVNSYGNRVSYGAYYLKVKVSDATRSDEQRRWLTVLR